jgi:hypothetical protein
MKRKSILSGKICSTSLKHFFRMRIAAQQMKVLPRFGKGFVDRDLRPAVATPEGSAWQVERNDVGPLIGELAPQEKCASMGGAYFENIAGFPFGSQFHQLL